MRSGFTTEPRKKKDQRSDTTPTNSTRKQFKLSLLAVKVMATVSLELVKKKCLSTLSKLRGTLIFLIQQLLGLCAFTT